MVSTYNRESPEEDVDVILLAGGVGSRTGKSSPKQFLKLKGKEIARYSFDRLVAHPRVKTVVVVAHPEYRMVFCRDDEGRDAKLLFADPGSTRYQSVCNGIDRLTRYHSTYLTFEEAANRLVAIHDSARPFVSRASLDSVFKRASETGAAILGSRCKSTLKKVEERGFISETVDRHDLFEAQTPQVFRAGLLIDGIRQWSGTDDPTDDACLVEGLTKVWVLEGGAINCKITTAEDLEMAEAIMEWYFKSLVHIV